MQRITPPLMARGKYVLKSPYVINAAMEYQCVAVRDFVDCYRKGENVEGLYYTPVGLIDGANGFSFDAEAAAGVKIITLKGIDSSILYVPDSYIQSYPTQSEVTYKQVILACTLGILPDAIDLTDLIEDIQGRVIGITGVTANVTLVNAPVLNNPTEADYLAFEQIRLGNISITETSQQQIDRLTARIEALNETIRLMGQQTV